ncbi:MAG: zinc dependent phospholipase C family protein [Chitinophagales bacterium]|nr:zinc dependent phospholipase C family protein [Chitinophagales bacterium]MDW8427003.1 zinc dependent phospholipase C family protein [Chitinophagales bacterium]
MQRSLLLAGGLVAATLIAAGSWLAFGWGFWAHKRINRVAVYTLPPGMMVFYKKHIDWISEHAVDADKRRYSDPDEAPRHYIDLDRYGNYPFDSLPRNWYEAVEKFSEDTLKKHGIVPWHVLLELHQLTEAFKARSKWRILAHSADLGHYIADAHVPLHCTSNYNGQKTNQRGIHSFWESRIPELFGEEYDYFVGKATYVVNPSREIWNVVLESASMVDSVLALERELTERFASDEKFTFEMRNNQSIRTYSRSFAAAYHHMLNRMQERRMRQAILRIGSFWYTAWVNAGQPSLAELADEPMPQELQLRLEAMDRAWREGRPVGTLSDCHD